MARGLPGCCGVPGRALPENCGDHMRNIFRALLAGWGARRLGGGCLTTIIIFVILYWLLGHVF
jgi:hypothetical protein